MDLLKSWFHKLLPTSTSGQTNRKRRAEDSSDSSNVKVARVEISNAYGDSGMNTKLAHYTIQTERTNSRVYITKWDPNGKENQHSYFPLIRSSTMQFNPNLANSGTEEHNNTQSRARKMPKEVERELCKGASLSLDNDVVELPQPQNSCNRNLPAVVKVPSSRELNRKANDDVQILKEQISASKDGHVPHAMSTRKPFKAIDPISLRQSSTPIVFRGGRQTVGSPDFAAIDPISLRLSSTPSVLSGRRQPVGSPEQSGIETLPSSNLGNVIAEPYRGQFPTSDSSSTIRRSNTTLNQIRRTEELRKYDRIVAFNTNRTSPHEIKPSFLDSRNSTMLRPSALWSSSQREKKPPEKLGQVSCDRIVIPIQRISRDEPSTSATRHQAEDPELQCIGQFTNTSRLPLQSTSTDIEEIIAKYAEREKHNRQAVEEYQQISRLLEDRNRQASKLKKKSDISEIEESLHTYLKMIEEFPDEKEEEEIPALPELTADMEAEINTALNAPQDAVLANAFNITIKGRDMRTLKPLAWLNDEVINFYMNLLIERGKGEKYPSVYAFNTFFFPKLLGTGYDSLKRWTKKVDIFAHDLLLVPVHRGMHWCMAIINVKEKVIRYYDSMNGRYPQCADALLNYLQKESLDKKKQPFDTSGWSKEHAEDIPQQNNGSDCGMFACMYAEYVSRGVPITFTQDDMPYFRRKAVYEILKATLLC